jgi:hypothetical protein
MAIPEPGPELGILPEGFHATIHPRAGEVVALLTGPRGAPHTVRVVDWYDRVFQRLWKADALAGEPRATSYANRLAVLGLSDSPHAVVVSAAHGGALFLVHQSEITPLTVDQPPA